MANIINTKVILDGSRFLILAIYLKSDGTGELDGEVIVDPADYAMADGQRLRLVEVDYSFSGFDGVLEFDTGESEPNFKWVLSESANMAVDFCKWGNLIDDSGLDGTGKLLLSTTGFTSSSDQGSILLKLRK